MESALDYLQRTAPQLEALLAESMLTLLRARPERPVAYLAQLLASRAEVLDPTPASEGAAKTVPKRAKNSAADRVLSKLVGKLLRHEAINLSIPITPDGWVSLPNILNAINSNELRRLVGSAASELQGVAFDEAAVRRIVAIDDKQRYLLREHATGVELRAAQGHTMDGVVASQTQLSAETAPRLAVHGTYWRAWEGICKTGGLSRMTRHHIHLARDLPSAGHVMSGMRADAELHVWVDVARALSDGYSFAEAANGVVLCDGKAGSGVLPLHYFDAVVDVHSGADLMRDLRWSLPK
jgi:2'-phosphotransferase